MTHQLYSAGYAMNKMHAVSKITMENVTQIIYGCSLNICLSNFQGEQMLTLSLYNEIRFDYTPNDQMFTLY